MCQSETIGPTLWCCLSSPGGTQVCSPKQFEPCPRHVLQVRRVLRARRALLARRALRVRRALRGRRALLARRALRALYLLRARAQNARIGRMQAIRTMRAQRERTPCADAPCAHARRARTAQAHRGCPWVVRAHAPYTHARHTRPRAVRACAAYKRARRRAREITITHTVKEKIGRASCRERV